MYIYMCTYVHIRIDTRVCIYIYIYIYIGERLEVPRNIEEPWVLRYNNTCLIFQYTEGVGGGYVLTSFDLR